MSEQAAWPVPVPDPGEALWQFSLRFYRAPGVAPACLALQDAHQVDVNLLLCLLWRAAQGDCIDPDRLAKLESAVAGWRAQLVAPLRGLRRELKERSALTLPGVAPLREKIKALELEAEHLQQQRLAQVALQSDPRAAAAPGPANPGTPQDPGELARAHLRHYETMLGCRFDEALLNPLLQALAQA
ncbi:MAG: TIGR02444 family protein [Quisquiliibacterium sp.]